MLMCMDGLLGCGMSLVCLSVDPLETPRPHTCDMGDSGGGRMCGGVQSKAWTPVKLGLSWVLLHGGKAEHFSVGRGAPSVWTMLFKGRSSRSEPRRGVFPSTGSSTSL